MHRIETIAVVINPLKHGAGALAGKILEAARSQNVSGVIIDEYPVKRGSLRGANLICVIGGDGTLLGVVREAYREQIPVMGINLGKLGFLATYSPDNIVEQIPGIIEGRYCTDERSLILAGKEGQQLEVCLNEVAIKSTSINLTRLRVSQNGKHVSEYACDGLLFATPTGSTAYNLSAGGPILHPQNNSIAMTPICAHTLSNRSFIFPADVELSVGCDCDLYQTSISIDGHALPAEQTAYPFIIRTAPRGITLIHDYNYSHYATLRSKLNWV